MKLSDFEIGKKFSYSGKQYLCTDKGTRTILCIELDDREDQSWFEGPPYAVPEISFDETIVEKD